MATDPQVKPGQVWADLDPRCEGRRVRVDFLITVVVTRRVGFQSRKVSVEFAECTIVTQSTATAAPGPGRRTTRISVDRFRPVRNGFRLVEEVSDAD